MIVSKSKRFDNSKAQHADVVVEFYGETDAYVYIFGFVDRYPDGNDPTRDRLIGMIPPRPGRRKESFSVARAYDGVVPERFGVYAKTIDPDVTVKLVTVR